MTYISHYNTSLLNELFTKGVSIHPFIHTHTPTAIATPIPTILSTVLSTVTILTPPSPSP